MEDVMTAHRPLHRLLFLGLILALAVGCQQQRAADSPEERIQSALNQAQISGINISENRETRTITLTGEVDSPDLRSRAEEIARTNSGGWTINNEIAVRQPGQAGTAEQREESAEDRATREKIMAEINAAPDLDEVDIRMDVEGGVVTLKGEVRNEAQKRKAEQVAKQITGVKQVRNELEVDPRGAQRPR
jgi:hyperosmotically inducible protein